MEAGGQNGGALNARVAILERQQTETFRRLRSVDRLDERSRATQEDVAEIRSSMATKDDVAALRSVLEKSEARHRWTWGQAVLIAVAVLGLIGAVTSALITAGAA